MALGLGKTLETATLGQPLSFTVALMSDADEPPIDTRCLRAHVVVGERPLQAGSVQARIERLQGTDERQVRITTSQPIDEPIVSVTLTIGCPPLLTRTFVVFADPPLVSAPVGDSDPATVSSALVERSTSVWDGAVPPDRLVSPPPASKARPAAKPRPARDPAAAAARRERKAAAQKARPAAPPRSAKAEPDTSTQQAAATESAGSRPLPPSVVIEPVAKPSGPVLKLDPGDELLLAPPLRISKELSPPDPARAASAAAALAEAQPDAAQREKDEAQLLALEQAVRQLKDDYTTRQRTFNELSARNKVLEARPDGRLVYLLAGLCVVLAGAVGAMVFLRRRDRQRPGWWSESSMLWPPGDVAAPASHVPPSPSLLMSSYEGPALAPESVAHIDVDMPGEPSMPYAPFAAAAAAEGSAPAPFARKEDSAFDDAQTPQPRRPTTAEELIDLEQQVDFFVALGQDEAAIDLLMGHVRSTGGSSPLPYIKLLEIYRRRNEQEPYERIRERFNRRFNAQAPAWGLDPESGLQLEDYPEVMGRLQQAWAVPSSAVALLDVLLFKRDTGGPVFDVPAYRSLVFLYGIARELSQESGEVDLLL